MNTASDIRFAASPARSGVSMLAHLSRMLDRRRRPTATANSVSGLLPASSGPDDVPAAMRLSGEGADRRLVVQQALDRLFSGRFFSICVIQDLMKLVGATPQSEAYRLLRALHCVHYEDMRPELIERLPHLVNECLRPRGACVATDIALRGIAFERAQARG